MSKLINVKGKGNYYNNLPVHAVAEHYEAHGEFIICEDGKAAYLGKETGGIDGTQE